ncbi:hypothetical protein BOX15_Mlig017887g1 [Macrostomum lignano]|uniref:KASH domain-containing protein n=2 Tax=Macrostomum lignano TaxID=282301 RepID=A0A267FN04_9PLAT|nr:hypothetical protein BOX15_Mlig017887g1 [Macrostomum lignano]
MAAESHYRDVSHMRLHLSSSLASLANRDASYRSALPGIAEIHADCLQLAADEIDCESLRAAYSTVSIQAESADADRTRRWRRMLADTSQLWLQRSRAVERLVCRLEAAFLRHVIKFADEVDRGDPDVGTEARRLGQLAETLGALADRLDYPLSCEFELCQSRICLFLASKDGQQHRTAIGSMQRREQQQQQQQQQQQHQPLPPQAMPGQYWPATASGLEISQQPWEQFLPAGRWLLWLVVVAILVAAALKLWSIFRTESCGWTFDWQVLNERDGYRPY